MICKCPLPFFYSTYNRVFPFSSHRLPSHLSLWLPLIPEKKPTGWVANRLTSWRQTLGKRIPSTQRTRTSTTTNTTKTPNKEGNSKRHEMSIKCRPHFFHLENLKICLWKCLFCVESLLVVLSAVAGFRWVARAVCVNVVAWSADSIRRPPSTMLAWHRATIFSKCLQSADSRRKPFEQFLKSCSLFDDLHLLFYFFHVTFDPWIAAANLNYVYIYILCVCVCQKKIV